MNRSHKHRRRAVGGGSTASYVQEKGETVVLGGLEFGIVVDHKQVQPKPAQTN